MRHSEKQERSEDTRLHSPLWSFRGLCFIETYKTVEIVCIITYSLNRFVTLSGCWYHLAVDDDCQRSFVFTCTPIVILPKMVLVKAIINVFLQMILKMSWQFDSQTTSKVGSTIPIISMDSKSSLLSLEGCIDCKAIETVVSGNKMQFNCRTCACFSIFGYWDRHYWRHLEKHEMFKCGSWTSFRS